MKYANMRLGMRKLGGTVDCKRRSRSHNVTRTFDFCILVVFLAATASSFNVADLSRSKVFSSSHRGSEFGYSVSTQENDQGKWLIVGAPKDPSNYGHDPLRSKAPKDGNVYSCNMNVSKKMSRKERCQVVSFNITGRTKKTLFSCDFDNCDLNQWETTDFNWTRTNRATRTPNTGPQHDHTYQGRRPGQTYGYYYHIETSRERNRIPQVGESAMISTPVFPGTSGSCVRFWYHMFGSSTGSLNVYMYTNVSGLMIIWNRNGNKGNQWFPAYITIVTEHPYSIVFEAIQGTSYTGDIALDDIEMAEGQCSEDIEHGGQSIGSSIASNPKTGELMTCAPKWKHNCSGSIQVSGLCYLMSADLQSNNMTILSPSLRQVCNAVQLDLVFMIDESNSVGDSDFTDVKFWLRNIISSLPVGTSYTQVALATYNEQPRVIFYLNDFYRIEDIRDALNRVTHKGGDTAIGKALDHLTDDIFSVEHGMRPNAKHVAVIVTDGKSRDDVAAPAERAEAKGITLFVIGVGDVSMPHLQMIASEHDNHKHVYHEQDYSALERIRSQLTESITALESQGKTYTTEQSQSGFSSSFVDDTLVLGAPGLNDWSGGFATYSKLRPPAVGYSFPKTTSFEELLVSSYDPVEVDPFTTEAVTTSQYVASPTEGTIADMKTSYSNDSSNNHSSETDASNAFPTSMNNLLQRNFGGLFSDSGNDPTMSSFWNSSSARATSEGHVRMSSAAKMTSAVRSGKGQNSQGQAKALRKRDVLSPTAAAQRGPTRPIPSLVRKYNDDAVMNMLENAYFGYALTSGILVEHGHRDLVVGAPRMLSIGSVFVIRISNFSAKYSSKMVIREHRGKQMGSYYGHSLCTTDTNNDGIDELFVGAPLFMDEHQDEGLVFVYVSATDPSGQPTQPSEIVLHGAHQSGSRFGFSLAAAGDLNKDGFNDIIVGAPSTSTGDGAILVYNGRPDTGISLKPSQIILASQKKKNSPVFFGFSLQTGFDIDGNGYDDIVVGAPGSDKVFVLYVRPVIHSKVVMRADPDVFNLTTPSASYSALCDNQSAVCSSITVCFSLMASGDIASTVPISYNLSSDVAYSKHDKRAEFEKDYGEVKIITNKTTCRSLLLRAKLPVRNQLTPITIRISYQMSGKRRKSSSKTAIFDAFDVKPVETQISFAKLCKEVVCRCDLKISAVKSGPASQVIFGKKRLIEFSLNVSNHYDAAYDVHLDVAFDLGLYMIRAVPLGSERCMNLALDGLITDEEHEEHEHSDEDKPYNMLSLTYVEAVMRRGMHCAFKLQFGTRWDFQGGKLAFTVNVTSTSSELEPADNSYTKHLKVVFETDFQINGLAKPEELHFEKGERISKIRSLKDIGPPISHAYQFINKGPSKIPRAEFKIAWPAMTSSGYDVLYLTDVSCTPKEACECDGLKTLVNHDQIGPRNWRGAPVQRGDGPVDLGRKTNPKKHEKSSVYFHEYSLDCVSSDTIVCENLICNIHNLEASQTVAVQLDFRLWKETLMKGRVWLVSLSTQAVASTNSSLFITSSAGKPLQDLVFKATTSALNEDFHEDHDHDDSNLNDKWWIYLAAALVGLFVLLLAVLLLKKMGFFKSKYRDQLEEDLKWEQTYKYTAAHQPSLYQHNSNFSNNGQEMSTFQKHLPQSSTL